jgi:UDP-glucose 4-epimerase
MHVFIAGVAGPTGRLLAESLSAAPEIAAVTGLDQRPCVPPLADVRFVRARFLQPDWIPHLAGVDVAIHVLGAAWPGSRRDTSDAALFERTRFFFEAVQAAGVRKLILVTSAALYGTQTPGSNDRVTESASVRGHSASAYARARARVSDYLDVVGHRAAGGSEPLLTRLRVAWIVGGRHSALAQYCRTMPMVARGYEDRTLDLVHEDDVIAAIRLALHSDLPGVYNVCADAPITFRDLAALAGQERDSVALARIIVRAWWRWRWRGQAVPSGWVCGLYRAGSLDTHKLRAVGWEPRYAAHQAAQAMFNRQV